MSKKLSCGIIILNELNEFLAGHATGSWHYDLPKGGMNPNETPLQCATRECFEETGLRVNPSNLKDLGVLEYAPHKDLHLFVYRVRKADIDMSKLHCCSTFVCAKTNKVLPEMDGFSWVDVRMMEGKCSKHLIKLMTNLKLIGEQE